MCDCGHELTVPSGEFRLKPIPLEEEEATGPASLDTYELAGDEPPPAVLEGTDLAGNLPVDRPPKRAASPRSSWPIALPLRSTTLPKGARKRGRSSWLQTRTKGSDHELRRSAQVCPGSGGFGHPFPVRLPPQLRIGGLIRNVEGPVIEQTALCQFAASIAPPSIAQDLDGATFPGRPGSLTVSRSWAVSAAALYGQRGSAGLVMHVVPATRRQIRPAQLAGRRSASRPDAAGNHDCDRSLGFGKIDDPGRHCRPLERDALGKIVTIEDPVEVLHTHKKALVAQREIGTDVASMAEGIEQAIARTPT